MEMVTALHVLCDYYQEKLIQVGETKSRLSSIKHEDASVLYVFKTTMQPTNQPIQPTDRQLQPNNH